MAPRLLIVGAGGFGRAVAEAAVASAGFEIVGFADDRSPALAEREGIRILGRATNLECLKPLADFAVVAIGDNALRANFARKAVQQGFALATVIHPRAFVSPSARVGVGTMIMAGSVIGSSSVLGQGVIVHYGSAIDHDCAVGSFSHIGVGACMIGGVVLGERVWLHAGCTLGRAVQIGDDVVVSESQR